MLPLRPNVCLLVINKNREIFLGERLGEPGVYQLPQGGVEQGTSPEENVIREAHEELGVDRELIRVKAKLKATHSYEFDNVPDYAKGRWRGQAQTFWVVEFLGEDKDIKLDRFEAEFSSWRWCSVAEVLKLAEPKRVKGYNEALREFEMLSYSV